MISCSGFSGFDKTYPPVSVSRANDSMVVHRFVFNGKVRRFGLWLVKPDGSALGQDRLKRFRSITMESLNANQYISIQNNDGSVTGIDNGQKGPLRRREFSDEFYWYWPVLSLENEGVHFNLEIVEKTSGNPDPVHMRIEEILVRYP